MRLLHQSSLAQARSAFTLLEVLVTVIILAIMGTMIVPRFTGNNSRAFRHTVEKVADTLMMFAQHESLGQRVVGLAHNLNNNSLELMLLDSDNLSGTSGYWRRDPFVAPVKLPSFMMESDIEIYADDERFDATEMPLSNELGKDRPTITIVLRGADEHATITLYPYGVSPEIVSSYSDTSTGRMPVDLDTSGRSREDW